MKAETYFTGQAFAMLTLLICSVTPSSFAQTCVNGGACNPASLNKIVYVDGVTHTTIQSCVTAAGANGTCVVPANYSETLASSVTISTSNTTLRCEPGAVIQQGTGFNSEHLIVITGNNATVTGCTLQGNSSATNSALIIAGNVSGVTLSNNTLENIASGDFGLYIGPTVKNFQIAENTLTNCIAGHPIYVISSATGNNPAVTTNGHIRGNTIATSGGNNQDDILVFTNTALASLSSVEISSNVMSAGPSSSSCPSGGGCFCVEVGGFTGGPGPTDIVVNGNICTATTAINGGYSLAGNAPVGYAVTGNLFDANNQQIDIAAYELSGANASATGNVARNLNSGDCLSINMLSSSNISRNECVGFSNAFQGRAIHVYAGSAGQAGNNVISNNKIVFPASSTNAHYGIWVQCNNGSAVCSGNNIVGNHIEGNGGSATIAIVLEHDSGTIANTTVALNEIVNTNEGVDIGTGVLDTWYLSGVNVARVPLVNNGTGTIIK